MLDRQLERPAAKAELAQLDAAAKRLRRARFGRSTPRPGDFDITLNAEFMDAGQMAEVLRAAAAARCLAEQGLLSADAEARIQFRTRLDLARHGMVPAGRAHLKRAAFGHPSEEMFANLLDFYRIQWQYEPRSFPLQWDKDGNVMEAFTPDFYLPEFDFYVELTTMKQALVTQEESQGEAASRDLSAHQYPGVLPEGFSGSGIQIRLAHGRRSIAHAGGHFVSTAAGNRAGSVHRRTGVPAHRRGGRGDQRKISRPGFEADRRAEGLGVFPHRAGPRHLHPREDRLPGDFEFRAPIWPARRQRSRHGAHRQGSRRSD